MAQRRVGLFRRYPWLRIVILLAGMVTIALIFAVMGKIIKTEDGQDETGTADLESATHEEAVTEETSGAVTNEVPEVTREVEQIGAGQVIALTFDDGPSEYTERLLDILKKKQVPATFFVLGNKANAYPDTIRREMAEGHEVESHTMSHQNLAKLDEAGIRTEIIGAEQTICTIEGKANCIKYLRPPYGEVSDTVRSVVGKPMIGWSIDTLDWQSKDPQAIQDNTLGVIRGGAIILLHDIYETSIEGAERIINELKAAGFTFVTVDEMAQKYGANLAAGSYYRGFNLD